MGPVSVVAGGVLKRFLPTKDRQRKRWKIERRLAKFDRGAKRCEKRMAPINDRILFQMLDDRRRKRELEVWERELQEESGDSRLTYVAPTNIQYVGTTSWFPPQVITASTTVRLSGW